MFDIGDQRRELLQLLENFDATLVEAKAMKDKKSKILQCSKLNAKIKTQFESYELEVSYLDEEEKRAELPECSHMKSKWKEMLGRLSWLQKEIADVDAENSLMGRYGGGEEFPANVDQMTSMQAIKVGDEVQDRTAASLQRTLRMGVEAEQIGINVMQKMNAQDEQMDKINAALSDIDDGLERSKKLMNQMLRAASGDRCIQALCGFITIFIVVVIVLLVGTNHDDAPFKVDSVS